MIFLAVIDMCFRTKNPWQSANC